MGGKHPQTPTTAAEQQPDGKRGRLKINLGPSLADASEDVEAPVVARVPRERGTRGGKSHGGAIERRKAKAQSAAARATDAGRDPAA